MNKINERKIISDEHNSEFSYNENKSNIKISFERIAFIFFVFFIIAIIFSSKVILLSLQTKPEIRKISKKENFRASILDKEGNPIRTGDHDRRFFEAAWMHKYQGKYYFSYSTGNTHRICYAIGDNPYGPFTYQGVILTPVVGWTTHHGIISFKDKWYLFHHDSVPSGGKTWLRSLKVSEMEYNADGTIKMIDGID